MEIDIPDTMQFELTWHESGKYSSAYLCTKHVILTMVTVGDDPNFDVRSTLTSDQYCDICRPTWVTLNDHGRPDIDSVESLINWMTT
jgi:hypothetical protein